MLNAPMHWLNGHAPRVYDTNRNMQREHVYDMLRRSGKYTDEHCIEAARKIVERCAVLRRGGV